MKEKLRIIIIADIVISLCLLMRELMTILSLKVSMKYEIDEANSSTTWTQSINDRKEEIEMFLNITSVNVIFIILNFGVLLFVLFIANRKKNNFK